MNRIGKYTVVGRLGRGGMGVVYRARDPVIQRDVAIKLIRKSDLGPGEIGPTLTRFKREAQAAGNLHHPNIVAVYEYGEDEEIAFIAMECVIGKSLRDHLQAGFRPEFRSFPEVIDQLLEGLDYSHSRGVVHRDLKPANLLISESGVVKISDFGIARMETSHLTMVGEIMGTPFYMSPEQFRGEPADERSDIYSAAVIIYEVLTGRRPFNGQGAAIMRQVLDEAPPPASLFEPRIGRELDAVIARALAKSRTERPRTARDFWTELHRAFQIHPGGRRAAAGSERAVPSLPGEPAEDRGGGPLGAAPRLPELQAAKVMVGNAAALRRAIGAGAGGVRHSPPPATEELALPAGAQRPCVLFVDDEERVLNALRSVFRSIYEVVTASDGEQALEIVGSRPVSLVVSDQRMPGLAGVDVLRRVREISPATVRILLTGYSDLAAIVGSINEGEVFRFINKPWNQQELMGTVAEAVSIATALQSSPLRSSPRRTPAPAVLVLNEEPTYRAVRELAGAAYPVIHAASLDEAFGLLARNEVGVLIADLESHSVDHAVVFKALKEEYPAILVIVTTGASDSEQIIGLINEARIFRFVNKPVNLALLGQHLDAALDRYEQLRGSPQLARTQSPSRRAGVSDAPLLQSFLSRLRSMRALLGAGIRA